jgi:3-carboxy-cis,cis-muconate cycloisomerase
LENTNINMYLKNPKIAQLISDEAHIQKMLAFEIALAKVQGELGIIPKEAADAISDTLKNLNVQPQQLEEGTLTNGIPTISLIDITKKALPDFAKDFLHFGATSQDVMDTANVLIIKEVIVSLEASLYLLIKNLGKLIEKWGNTPMIGRTRTQQAVPILFGQKVANWAMPLVRQINRIQEIKPRLLVLQMGGAAGNLSALGENGLIISNNLAKELDLNQSFPWHTQRDNLAEFAAWLAILSGILGKMGADILIMAQTEIGEIIENAVSGKSSTMPHKNNPILSEALVVLARKNATLISLQMQAILHTNERDGTAWALEWDTLPQMINNASTALEHANSIANTLQINSISMKRNLDFTNGLVFSEAATFMLSKHIPKSEAKKIVEVACEKVLLTQKNMSEILQELTSDLSIDWNEELKIENQLGISKQIIESCMTMINAL